MSGVVFTMNAPYRVLMRPITYLVCLCLLSLSWNRATNAFTHQSQSFRRRALDRNTALDLFFANAAEPTNKNNGHSISDADQVPFVIERISENPGQVVFQETAAMCIDVFFNDAPTNAPWKQVQLSYLRNLQQSDLYHRKTSRKWVNEMFVARRVIPVSEIGMDAALKKPIILDLHSIVNLPYNVDDDEDFVKDQVIGFVEVTEKTFGLPQCECNGKELLPVLTNLAVHPSFRKAGVGSELLQACEDIVEQQWHSHDEIVLEVEDDNPKALAFYTKRGYETVFEDPASRRYDTNGFFLQKKQCTKICMRKRLGEERGGSFNILQSLRQSVFSK